MENELKNNIKPKPKWLIPAIIIVGIVFLGIAIFSITSFRLNVDRIQPQDARRVGVLREIPLALGVYYEENGKFPEKLKDLKGLNGFRVPDDYGYFIIKEGRAVLLTSKLDDPKNSALKDDIDGNEFGVDCNDPVYCIIYKPELKDEFTDWQTYRNEEYGFEMKYPKNFKITKDKIKITYTGGQKWCQLELSDQTTPETPLINFEINPDGYGPFFPDKRYEIRVSKNNSIEILKVIPEESENPDDNYVWIISNSVKYNANDYFIHFIFREGEKDWEPIFKEILSTFKFIEPKQDFCGYSTNGSCSDDSNCITGGCSGQVCQSKSEEQIITTCEYADCYNPQPYGLTCGCKNNQCQWK